MILNKLELILKDKGIKYTRDKLMYPIKADFEIIKDDKTIILEYIDESKVY